MIIIINILLLLIVVIIIITLYVATRFDAKGKGLGMSGRRDVRDLPTLWPRYLYQHIHIFFMNLCLNTNIIDTNMQN